MQFSHYEVFDDEPADEFRHEYCELGFACKLLSEIGGYPNLSWDYLHSVLKPAIRFRQIKFFFDEDAVPVGYIVWVTLADDVEHRFINRSDFNLHYSEWNEGESLWVIDLLAKKGHLKYILAYLRDRLFVNYEKVRYFRDKRGRVVVKEISRSDRVSFFGQTYDLG